MQDNRHRPDIDDAFENKSWMEMESILDQEMPVRKRKRRFIWWFFGVGILLLTGLVYWGLPSYQNPDAPINNPSSIVYQEVGKNDLSNTQIEETFVAQEIPSIIKKDQEEAFRTSTNTTANEKSSFDKQVVDYPILSSNLSTTPSKKGIATDAVESYIALAEITQPTASERSIISNLGEFQRTIITLPYIPVDPSLLLLPKRDIEVIISSKPLIQPALKKWNWGMTGGVGTFKFTRPNEYQIGGFGQYALQNKWQLRVGLTYEYLRLNLLTDSSDRSLIFSADMDSAEADPSMDTVGTAGNMEDDNTPNQNFTEIDHLRNKGYIQYLTMPIAVEYQLTSKLQAYIGTNLYYGLSDSYKSLGREQTRLRRWDISTSTGMQYKIHPQVDLSIGYDIGWFEKRKNLVDPSNPLPSLNKTFSPLEGRIQLKGYWRF